MLNGKRNTIRVHKYIYVNLGPSLHPDVHHRVPILNLKSFEKLWAALLFYFDLEIYLCYGIKIKRAESDKKNGLINIKVNITQSLSNRRKITYFDRE